MIINKRQIKRIVEQVMESENETTFDQNFSRNIGLRNAIIRYLQSQGAYINRSRASAGDFDNIVARIVEMTDWSDQ